MFAIDTLMFTLGVNIVSERAKGTVRIDAKRNPAKDAHSSVPWIKFRLPLRLFEAPAPLIPLDVIFPTPRLRKFLVFQTVRW